MKNSKTSFIKRKPIEQFLFPFAKDFFLKDKLAVPREGELYPFVGELVKITTLDQHCQPLPEPMLTVQDADGNFHVALKSECRLAVPEDLI